MAHNPDQFQHRGADGRLGEARLPPGRRSTAPAPPPAQPGIERGVWVRTSRHGHFGRVTAVHDQCPESEWWIAAQEIPVTDEDRAGQWVKILCHGGGSVTAPISSVTHLTDGERPARLDNPYANKEFGDLPES